MNNRSYSIRTLFSNQFWFVYFFAGIAAICLFTGNGVFIHLVITFCIWSLLAVSVNVVLGFAGQASFGQAGFMAIGAYTSALLTKGCGIPFLLALIGAACLAAAVSLLLAIPCLRLRHFYLALGTVAFGEIVRVVAGESTFTGGWTGISGIPYAEIGGYALDSERFVYFVIIVTLVIFIVLQNLANSKIGRALKALSLSEDGVLTVGVNVTRLKIELFILSAVCCAIAGVIQTHFLLYVAPEFFVPHVPIMAFAACLIGGYGTIWGSLVGGIAITILPYVLEAYHAWQPIIWSAIAILIIIFLPEGLFPAMLKMLHFGQIKLIVSDILRK